MKCALKVSVNRNFRISKSSYDRAAFHFQKLESVTAKLKTLLFYFASGGYLHWVGSRAIIHWSRSLTEHSVLIFCENSEDHLGVVRGYSKNHRYSRTTVLFNVNFDVDSSMLYRFQIRTTNVYLEIFHIVLLKLI